MKLHSEFNSVGILGLALFLACHGVCAESTNETASASNTQPTPAESAPGRLDESAFRIVSERNIFNANRSGGTVRSASSRRPARVETFALTGTMAYEKGAFAFFEGTSTEFTKALKPNGVIAGYKLVDILVNGVKLEMDGQITELAVGTGMRREDQGTWKFTESVTSESSNGSSESNSRYARTDRGDRGRRGDDYNSERNGGSSPAGSNTASTTAATADQSEVLKRLMERREKESQ